MEHNIGLILEKRARLNPSLEAMVDLTTGLRLNYEELDQRANQSANMMTKLGVQKGDRVGLLIMNSVEFVEVFFGLAKIGAIVVPLNWRLVADELEYILKNSGTKLLVFGTVTILLKTSQLVVSNCCVY